MGVTKREVAVATSAAVLAVFLLFTFMAVGALVILPFVKMPDAIIVGNATGLVVADAGPMGEISIVPEIRMKLKVSI